MKIPSGRFSMGANSSGWKDRGYKDELPRHDVQLKPFCIMKDSIDEDTARKLRKKFNISAAENGEDNPNFLTWRAARELAGHLSREFQKLVRLPTEAEWEFAARGGLDNKEFPWGNIGDTYDGKSVRDIVLSNRLECRLEVVSKFVVDAALRKCVPKEAGGYEVFKELSCVERLMQDRVSEPVPNRYGLINMVNNDWEWTSSRYMRYPYNAADGRENPTPSRREFRVVRGGNQSHESCNGYNSLRGYGTVSKDYESSYQVRYVLEN